MSCLIIWGDVTVDALPGWRHPRDVTGERWTVTHTSNLAVTESSSFVKEYEMWIVHLSDFSSLVVELRSSVLLVIRSRSQWHQELVGSSQKFVVMLRSREEVDFRHRSSMLSRSSGSATQFVSAGSGAGVRRWQGSESTVTVDCFVCLSFFPYYYYVD